MPHYNLNEGNEEQLKNSENPEFTVMPAIAPHYSQQAEINKCNVSLSKYKKNALSKRRQHSSYKIEGKVDLDDDNNQYDSRLENSKEHKAISEIEQIKHAHSKKVLSDHTPTPKNDKKGFDFNKMISEELRKKQQVDEDKLVVRKSDLIELVPIRDDRIVTCKTKIEQTEQPDRQKDKSPTNDQSYREKPWIVYLRTLRIPIICPIHRKLFIMIQEGLKRPKPKLADEGSIGRGTNSILFNKNQIESSTAQGREGSDNKKKQGFNSITSMKV